MVFLAMEEEAEEAAGILVKNRLVLRREPAVLRRESVEFLDFALPGEGNPRTQPGGFQDICFDLRDLEYAGGVLVNVAGAEIVVPHERLNAAELGAVPVIESLHDDALEAQGEDVGGFPGMVV